MVNGKAKFQQTGHELTGLLMLVATGESVVFDHQFLNAVADRRIDLLEDLEFGSFAVEFEEITVWKLKVLHHIFQSDAVDLFIVATLLCQVGSYAMTTFTIGAQVHPHRRPSSHERCSLGDNVLKTVSPDIADQKSEIVQNGLQGHNASMTSFAGGIQSKGTDIPPHVDDQVIIRDLVAGGGVFFIYHDVANEMLVGSQSPHCELQLADGDGFVAPPQPNPQAIKRGRQPAGQATLPHNRDPSPLDPTPLGEHGWRRCDGCGLQRVGWYHARFLCLLGLLRPAAATKRTEEIHDPGAADGRHQQVPNESPLKWINLFFPALDKAEQRWLVELSMAEPPKSSKTRKVARPGQRHGRKVTAPISSRAIGRDGFETSVGTAKWLLRELGWRSSRDCRWIDRCALPFA